MIGFQPYETFQLLLQHLDEPASAGDLVVRFELLVLDELGFGLDLERCTATGAREDLAFVSPKSGRAVSRDAGMPWADRMLPLPGFLRRGSGVRADVAALEEAFRLTGFFFARHVYEPRGMAPDEARSGFIAALRRQLSLPKNGVDAA